MYGKKSRILKDKISMLEDFDIKLTSERIGEITMTLEELKEKERKLRIANFIAKLDKKFDEIDEELQLGKDYIDVIARHLFCSSCPFAKECDNLKDFDGAETKCHYLVQKYIDKPIIKIPIDEFLDKHLELLRAKLKNEALQGDWDDFAMRIQMCDVCPLYSNCTEELKCHKVLQERISLREVK